MNCPSCPAKPLALFICDDGVHRCYACKVKRPLPRQFPLQPAAPEPNFKSTPGPAQGVEYKSPNVRRQKGRIAVLNMIEAELREKIASIEGHKDWRKFDRFSSAHYAYTQAIKIVRDHHVISADGKPMREVE